MARAPDTGVPILFSKFDLKDGYWRMVVDEDKAWNFAYVLPPKNDDDPIMLVIPNALQMGWSESPPFFCICDFCNWGFGLLCLIFWIEIRTVVFEYYVVIQIKDIW